MLIPRILNMRIEFQEGLQDQAIWKPNEKGRFTLTSAWDIIRKKKAKTMTDTYTWILIPFRVSFLLWRALRRKLPTNEAIIAFGSEPQRCYCYNISGEDNIEHKFVSRNFAAYIWKFFAQVFAQHHINFSLRNFLMNWWFIQTRTEVQKLMYQTLPIFII